VDVWIIFYRGSGLELKHMEKGKISLPWDDFFSTCATGLRPALYLGRPRFADGAFTGTDRFALACEAYLTQRELWKALPKGCESFRLKIFAVSTAAPPHPHWAHTGASAGATTRKMFLQIVFLGKRHKPKPHHNRYKPMHLLYFPIQEYKPDETREMYAYQ